MIIDLVVIRKFDLNPIEKMWSWIKRKRKEWLADSVDLFFRVFFSKCMNN
jgi:transposase